MVTLILSINQPGPSSNIWQWVQDTMARTTPVMVGWMDKELRHLTKV